MEILIVIASFYLLLSLVVSQKLFIERACVALIFAAAIIVELLAQTDFLIPFCIAAILTAALPKMRAATVRDVATCAILIPIFVFFLTTLELMDGYAYSEIFFALAAAAICSLLFDGAIKQYACAYVIFFSYQIAMLAFAPYDNLTAALYVFIGWIYTQDFKIAKLRDSQILTVNHARRLFAV